MPHQLIEKVQAAMAEGDVMKALQACESEPGPMANVLTAGFSHVEEGYEVIEEAVEYCGGSRNGTSDAAVELDFRLRQPGPDARAARYGARYDHGVRGPGDGRSGHRRARARDFPGALDDGGRPCGRDSHR